LRLKQPNASSMHKHLENNSADQRDERGDEHDQVDAHSLDYILTHFFTTLYLSKKKGI
jgi:hypothetical protein